MSGAAPTAAQQEAYLNQIRNQMQAQMMQEIMGKMSEKCVKVGIIKFSVLFSDYYLGLIVSSCLFQLCTGKKGNHLDSTEVSCINNCTERYMETMQVVSQSIASRQA